MYAMDKEFKQYLKQADQDDDERAGELVGGMAHYLYNHWPWRLTVLLSVLAYASLC